MIGLSIQHPFALGLWSSYINFQISCNQPFSLIQAVSFRSFIRYINPVADNLLPESLSTTKALIIDQFTI
jgi:hypothetical protein